MKFCAIDIDDVLGSFSAVLNPALNRTFKRNVSVEQWTDFVMTAHYDISHQQFHDVIIDQDLLSSIVPYTGTKRALTLLRQAGLGVVLITSRGYHPRGLEVTKAWLTKHDLPYDDLIIKPEGMTKAQAAAEKYPGGFAFMVDDYEPNLDQMGFAGMARELALIDEPWNRANQDFAWGKNRYSSLEQFVEKYLSLAQTAQYA